MNTEITSSAIEQLQQLNAEIRNEAEGLNWEKVSHLVIERQQFLQSYFREVKDELDHNSLQAIESIIIENDKEIESTIVQQKTLSIKSGLSLKNAYRAINEYTHTKNGL